MGNIINTTDTSGKNISSINPYRYRGYRYDNEKGYYYLNSRYYNPDIGRFINADGLVGQNGDVLGHNMYIGVLFWIGLALLVISVVELVCRNHEQREVKKN